MGDRVILHSDINCCYASIEHLPHPELAGKPLAVGGDPEARHGIVLTADYIAKKYGVKTGMALWQAKEVCPDITFVSPRMDLYLSLRHIEMCIRDSRSMADRFNVYALCTPSVDGFMGTSTFFNATDKGIGGYKGAWRNHVLERIIGPAFIEKIHDAHILNETHPFENPDNHDHRQYDYVYENINQFVVLANSGNYFGGYHGDKEHGIHYLIASAKSTYSAFTQRHELGHGLFHLGDEYRAVKDPVAEELYTTCLLYTSRCV